MGKFKQHFLNLFLALIISLLCSCSNQATYKIEIPSTNEAKLVHVKPNVTIYIDASVSMKGYVNQNKDGYYPIKTLLPKLVFDYDEPDTKLKIFRITDNIIDSIPISGFPLQLQDGTIFKGKGSPLDKIFSTIIDTLKKNDLCFFVTDGILDFGSDNINNESESINITTTISGKLKNKNSSYAVFQFLSDFNGDHYFDYKNTGRGIVANRPYHDSILRNRPFYIWVFGDSEMIKEIFEKQTLKGYSNAETFNINYSELKPYLLEYPSEGLIIPEPDSSVITFKKIEKNDGTSPIKYSFTLGFDMSKVPEFFKSPKFLEKNYVINKEGLEVDLEVFDENSIKKQPDYGKLIKTISQKNLNRFIKININAGLSNILPKYSLVIVKHKQDWINSSTIPNDYKVSVRKIEGKTFKLSTLVSPFYEKYPSDTIISVVFNKTEKK